MKSGPASSKNGVKRTNKKRKRLNALQQVLPSAKQSMDKMTLTSKPVFFSGTPLRTAPNVPPTSQVFSAVADLHVVDTVEGAQMKLDNNTVFLLIPRDHALEKTTCVNEKLSSLYALEQAKRNPEKRGKNAYLWQRTMESTPLLA
jgi:hypothetical protein